MVIPDDNHWFLHIRMHRFAVSVRQHVEIIDYIIIRTHFRSDFKYCPLFSSISKHHCILILSIITSTCTDMVSVRFYLTCYACIKDRVTYPPVGSAVRAFPVTNKFYLFTLKTSSIFSWFLILSLFQIFTKW